jgi:putative ABC transport system permease protein
MYIPHDQFVHFSAGVQARARSLVVRTSRDPMALANAVRAELRVIDPEVPAAQVRDMASVVSESVSGRRLNVYLIASFGAVSLALAAIGLYGMMAFSVARRTREIGLRLAIGASRTSVLSLVLKEGVGLVLTGAAIGLIVAVIFSGSLADLLFDVPPRDMGILAGVVAMLILIGALASLVPAHRATRVDPLAALRAD